MGAMYKSVLWTFSNPGVRSTYDALELRHNGASLVVHSADLSTSTSSEPITTLVGQRFSTALSEELYSRGLSAKRVALRKVIKIEKGGRGRNRTRVELDLIAEVPAATQNDLIDALTAAKRKIQNVVGPNVKILLKAELKTKCLPAATSNDAPLMIPA